jgi:rhodanese-related sulfurtransferase
LLTLETLRAGIPKSFDLTKTSNIVVYCGTGNTHGPEATRILRQAGYTNAVNLAAGIQGWADAGLAIDKV